MEIPERIFMIGGSLLVVSIFIGSLKDEVYNTLPNINQSMSQVYQSDDKQNIKVQPALDYGQVPTGVPNVTASDAIQKLSHSVQEIAPQYGVLPSLILADASTENPSGPGNNFWGLGYDDNSTANNQSYSTIDDGIKAFLKQAIVDTNGKVQTTDAQAAMHAISDADGNHPPEAEYHRDPASNYWNKIVSQYKTYHLDKYDRDIEFNSNGD